MNRIPAKWSVFALLTLFACSEAVSHVPEGAVVYDLKTGEELSARNADEADGFYGTLQEEGQFIAFVRYRPDSFETTVVTAEGEQADSTGALCMKHNAVAGINGSYFDMENLTATTLVKDDGFVTDTTATAEVFRTNGAVVLNIEDIRIEACDTAERYTLDREALAGGPILMADGTTFDYAGQGSFFDKRHPRSLIGRDAEGGVWLVVVDGRFPGEAEGMSIPELTALAGRLGLTEALNLDGGGSSTLWVLPAGVLNHPCDNHRFDHEGQRIVPNALIVK